MGKSIFIKLSTAFALALLVGFVGCNREDIDYEQPVFELNKTQLEFDELGVAVDNDDSFTIQANREWSISVPDAAGEWVRISKLEGEGSQTISVIVLTNEGEPRSVKLKVSSSINYEYIEIVQRGSVAATPIYNEKVGESVEKIDGSWPYADQFTGWSREGSLDQSAVTYGGSGANVSNSGAAFQPADGSAITGAPYVGLNYSSSSTQRTFIINKINVSESSNLRLKFASLFQSDYSGSAQFGEITDQSFRISGSLDGSAWTQLTYNVSKDPAGGNWHILTSEFKVPEGTTELYLKFDAAPQNNQGYRVDDIKLTREGAGTTVIGEGVVPPAGAILSDNIGDTEVTANTQVDAFTGWLKSGSGASGVTYTGSAKTDVRKSVASSGYTGASGGNNIFFGSEDNGTFEIKDIDVTGKTQLTFSFGISWQSAYPDFSPIDNNTIKLSASIDGTNYTDLTFSNAATAGWVLATSEFKVPGGTTKLYIKFADPAAKSQVRLDDFTLEEGGSGTTVIGETTTPPLSFGNPAFAGTMTAGTALSGTKITIPYTHAKAESFTVNVAVSGTGATGIDAVTARNVILGTGSGNVELDITGTPTAAGDVTFTITGLTGLTTTTVNAAVQPGGSSGESFSALWNMTGIPAWGESPMNATDETGSGVTVGGLTKYGFTDSGSSGNNNWGGADFSENTESVALSAPVKYAYFTVTSASSFSISSLEATIRITKTGPTKTSIQYSIDSSAYAQADAIEFERPSSTTTFPKKTVDLSGIPALQNIAAGKTVTIRLVPVATEGTTTGNWYLNGADALSINGSTH